MLSKQEIKDILLANGFTERIQPDGKLDLNPYVYTAIEAILEAATKTKSSDKVDDYIALDTLTKISIHDPSPGTLSSAAQLYGVGPCSRCGFRKKYCKCSNKEKECND